MPPGLFCDLFSGGCALVGSVVGEAAPASVSAGAPANAAGAPSGDFQPYIFWAYGLVCLLLFLFTLWTTVEVRKLAQRLEYLKRRLERVERPSPPSQML